MGAIFYLLGYAISQQVVKQMLTVVVVVCRDSFNSYISLEMQLKL